MLSGRRLDLLDPSPLDVEIEDIAHGLARVARWNGQTLGDHAFSVAQHCVVVEEVCRDLSPGLSAQASMIALLHDGPEYVIGDMISPFKAVLGPGYRAFEDSLERAIHIRFGLPAKTDAKLKKLIKRADHISAWLEAVQLAGFSSVEADEIFGAPEVKSDKKLHPLPAIDAQALFLKRFSEIQAGL
ncbi:MAG: phosphohydrolase [Ponticaulis sp.]|nr:phosphohydrolase [Ponticaulis sp.]|tara:strand:+ start:10827 stop:11384 length:558 start_codon:yes stop_codon:yes gene_type:complete